MLKAKRRPARASAIASPRHIVAVACNVLLVLDQLVAHLLLCVSGKVAELRHAVDHVADEMEAVEVVAHDHIERRGRRPLLLVAANVDVAVVGAPVDQPGIAVMGKDDRLVGREQRIEIVVGNTVRMLLVWLQCHQIAPTPGSKAPTARSTRTSHKTRTGCALAVPCSLVIRRSISTDRVSALLT